MIGGGDWSEDRLVPDLWRAARAGRPVELRNPAATRPWQFVLDPLSGYLAYVEALAGPDGAKMPRALNFGPDSGDTITVAETAALVLEGFGDRRGWIVAAGPHPAEARALTLDSGLARRVLGWRARLTAREALRWAVEWYRGFDDGIDADRLTAAQIERYEAFA